MYIRSLVLSLHLPSILVTRLYHYYYYILTCVNLFDSFQWYAFEFLVVCIGKYGDVPKIPEFPRNKGPEIFKARSCIPLITANFKRKRLHNYLKGRRLQSLVSRNQLLI